MMGSIAAGFNSGGDDDLWSSSNRIPWAFGSQPQGSTQQCHAIMCIVYDAPSHTIATEFGLIQSNGRAFSIHPFPEELYPLSHPNTEQNNKLNTYSPDHLTELFKVKGQSFRDNNIQSQFGLIEVVQLTVLNYPSNDERFVKTVNFLLGRLDDPTYGSLSLPYRAYLSQHEVHTTSNQYEFPVIITNALTNALIEASQNRQH
jgi:hypothetical protein